MKENGEKDVKEVKLRIKGMTCTSCAQTIGTDLRKMDGVDFAGVNLVDKTALVHDLVYSGKVYFLSRPRRFGKSLLISTLDALFSGRKDLFEGLNIADTDYDFATYPVISIFQTFL